MASVPGWRPPSHSSSSSLIPGRPSWPLPSSTPSSSSIMLRLLAVGALAPTHIATIVHQGALKTKGSPCPWGRLHFFRQLGLIDSHVCYRLLCPLRGQAPARPINARQPPEYEPHAHQ